jgi:ATP/maltotriose-dependent transcriptional regulator MalT
MRTPLAGTIAGAALSQAQRVQLIISATDAAALLGLRELIEATPGLDIVAEAADGMAGGTNGTGVANGNSLTAYRDLTRREREVMGLIAAGLSNRQIADELVVSQKTVKNHICRIYQCIGVHERSQAVSRWKELSAAQAG